MDKLPYWLLILFSLAMLFLIIFIILGGTMVLFYMAQDLSPLARILAYSATFALFVVVCVALWVFAIFS